MNQQHNDADDPEFITDKEAARMFRLSTGRWFELQKDPTFPAPYWFGPRGKRHMVSELIRWAQGKKSKEAPSD